MSARRCANIPARSKPDFHKEQKIIFQAIGQSVFSGESELLWPCLVAIEKALAGSRGE
jgi:hypothetical protein